MITIVCYDMIYMTSCWHWLLSLCVYFRKEIFRYSVNPKYRLYNSKRGDMVAVKYDNTVMLHLATGIVHEDHNYKLHAHDMQYTNPCFTSSLRVVSSFLNFIDFHEVDVSYISVTPAVISQHCCHTMAERVAEYLAVLGSGTVPAVHKKPPTERGGKQIMTVNTSSRTRTLSLSLSRCFLCSSLLDLTFFQQAAVPVTL